MKKDQLTFTKKLQNKWNDKLASKMSEPELLLYRSNLLGSDLRITNFGGGNTSAKIEMPDTLTGKNQNVLWVKGSGGDLGSMNLDGFSTLYMDKLNKLKELYRGLKYEDEMVKTKKRKIFKQILQHVLEQFCISQILYRKASKENKRSKGE